MIDSVNNEFVFKVEQDKTNLAAGQIASGTYGSCTFTDGVAEITIAGEDSITIPGLPVGTYTVTEVTAGDIDLNNTQGKDFYLEKTEYQIGTGTATEIPVEVDLQSDTTVTVTNTYAPYKSLTVTKSIDGEMASSTEPFGFTIIKTAQSGATASLAVEDVVGNENVTSIANGATSNTITLDMKANGQVTIYNLKASDVIEIEEDADVEAQGYVVTVNVPKTGEGSAQNGFATDANNRRKATVTVANVVGNSTNLGTIDFQNYRAPVAPTGLESNHTTPYVLMITAAGMAGLALIGGIVARRIRRRRED